MMLLRDLVDKYGDVVSDCNLCVFKRGDNHCRLIHDYNHKCLPKEQVRKEIKK